MAEHTEISNEAFRILTERSGMKLSADELEALKPMYEHFARQIAPIHDLELDAEDLAVVFQPEQ
ncbi:MAG: hypothetical protein IIB14_09750 [Chloroflexi bacterium]|nr:hypothetical protein [Chloroflexota bacterium]